MVWVPGSGAPEWTKRKPSSRTRPSDAGATQQDHCHSLSVTSHCHVSLAFSGPNAPARLPGPGFRSAAGGLMHQGAVREASGPGSRVSTWGESEH